MPPSVTINQVAEAAGVSPTTVSFVLNNRGNISPETRERVMRMVQKLGYTRSAHARNLRDNQARVIGYALDRKRSRFNPVLDNFLLEVLHLCEASGRNLLVFSHGDDKIAAYRKLFDSRQVDGFILSHTRQEDERFAYLQAEEIPFAAFGRSASPLDEVALWVDIDGTAGIQLATEHLINQGYQRIGFVGWPIGSVSGDARYAGYREALAKHGMPYHPEWEIRTENDVAHGYHAAVSLLNQHNPPDAVVTVSDILGVAVLQYAQEIGQPMGVTGFDDTPLGEFTSPTLTSLRQPVEQAAGLLVEMLIAQLEDRAVAQRQILLKPELVIRGSSTRRPT